MAFFIMLQGMGCIARYEPKRLGVKMAIARKYYNNPIQQKQNKYNCME
jgi:hypothetical protein